MDRFIAYEDEGGEAGRAGAGGALDVTLSKSSSTPLRRLTGTMGAGSQAESARHERHTIGLSKFAIDRRGGEGGALSWRTRSGHALKDQTYYTQLSRVNKWDLPRHAGTNTWKEWHGPRMRNDAAEMERLDQRDELNDQKAAHRSFVKTTRSQTMDRFSNRKMERSQLETASSWAPRPRPRREVNDEFNYFDDKLSEAPQSRLKVIFTDKVLSNDRQAVRWLTQCVQNEETFKCRWKQMESNRRDEIRSDLQMRRDENDMLMYLSGQPPRREPQREPQTVTNAQSRTREIAVARKGCSAAEKGDVTKVSDFRGLIHPDCEHLLEVLQPGVGGALCKEFRRRATQSAQPGWPPPDPPETPRQEAVAGARAEAMSQKARLPAESTVAPNARMPHGSGPRVEEDSSPARARKPDRAKHAQRTSASPTQRILESQLISESPTQRIPRGGRPADGFQTLGSPTSSSFSRRLARTTSAPMLELRKELDEFEERVVGGAPQRMSNFFGSPRTTKV